MDIINTGKKGHKVNLQEIVNVLRYKLLNNIINEQIDPDGQNTFKVFHRYFISTAC